jgi:hypothetical protein
MAVFELSCLAPFVSSFVSCSPAHLKNGVDRRNCRFASPIFNSAYRPTGFPRLGFGPVLVRGADSRAGMDRFRVSRPCNPQKCAWSNRFRRHFSLPPSRHQNQLRSADRLSGWHRQRHNPLQHAAKQPPRQALRQLQPIVAGGRAYLIRRPPVFTSRYCKLVPTSWRPLPAAPAAATDCPDYKRSRSATAAPHSAGSGGSLSRVIAIACLPSLIHCSAVPRLFVSLQG